MFKVPKKHQIYIILGFVILASIITAALINNKDQIKNHLFKKSAIINIEQDSFVFSKEYPKVETENIYVYVTAEHAISLIKTGTGIIYFGFPACPWCQYTVPILNEVAKAKGVKQIYCYDIKEIRANNTPEYKELVSLLKDYLSDDDEGNPRIYVPDIYFVKDGIIQGNSKGTSKIGDDNAKADTYYTVEVIENIKTIMKNLIDKVYESTCLDNAENIC